MTGPEYAEVWKELKRIRRRVETLEGVMLSEDDKQALDAQIGEGL